MVREVPLHGRDDSEGAAVGRTPAERLEMMWQLTVDAWEFKGEPVGESRLPSIDGVDFAGAWPDRLTASLGELDVPVLSREHLIRNKRACGRPKDIADLAWLERER